MEKPAPQRSRRLVVKSIALESYCWGFDPGLPPRAVRLGASCLTSLRLSFFTCKIETILLPDRLSMKTKENVGKALSTVAGTEKPLRKCEPLLLLMSRGRENLK